MENVKHEAWPLWRVSDRYKAGATFGSARLQEYVADGLSALRAAIKGEGRFQAGDKVIQLLVEERLWMSDSRDEFLDCLDAIHVAEGRVLVHGLGLGCYLHCILAKPEVEHVDVVESSADVLGLITPYFAAHNGRVTFHHDNALTKKWPKGTRWKFAWHDIWPSINTDDLREHGTLNRRFARRVDVQACWKHYALVARRRQGY